MLFWMLKKALTYLLANKQMVTNIDQGKTVEYTKLNKNKIREQISYWANIKRWNLNFIKKKFVSWKYLFQIA